MFMLLCSTVVSAQQYHDAENEDLYGNVKRCVYIGNATKILSFSNDGKIDGRDVSNAVYNEEGYMLSCTRTEDYITGSVAFYYNEYNKLEKQILTNEGGRHISTRKYDNTGLLIQEVFTVESGGMSVSMEVEYSYNEFDNHNNWLYRTTYINGKPKFYDRRKIEYWQ